MASILHIKGSPKGPESASNRISQMFLDEYLALNSHDTVHEINLFDCDLPEIGRRQIVSKFAPIFGDEPDIDTGWESIKQEIDRFSAADKVLFSSPMWNFSVPYKVKHYIDVLVQPFLTFGHNIETNTVGGLLHDRPLQFILTRSSTMPDAPTDFQLPYLKSIFELIGIRDIRAICAWQTTQPSADERERYVQSFREAAKHAAKSF